MRRVNSSAAIKAGMFLEGINRNFSTFSGLEIPKSLNQDIEIYCLIRLSDPETEC